MHIIYTLYTYIHYIHTYIYIIYTIIYNYIIIYTCDNYPKKLITLTNFLTSCLTVIIIVKSVYV